jgi:hypothetical protein
MGEILPWLALEAQRWARAGGEPTASEGEAGAAGKGAEAEGVAGWHGCTGEVHGRRLR